MLFSIFVVLMSINTARNLQLHSSFYHVLSVIKDLQSGDFFWITSHTSDVPIESASDYDAFKTFLNNKEFEVKLLENNKWRLQKRTQ